MLKQILINGVIAGSIYAIVAVSFTIIYKTVKFFHFAHGIVYTAGAYFAYCVLNALPQHLTNSIIIWSFTFFLSIILAALLGVGINKILYVPLRKEKAHSLVFLIVSFGVFIFLQNLIQLVFGAQILTLRTGSVQEGHQILGAVITNIQILIISVSCLLLLALWLLIQHGRLGKAIRAVSDDPIAASVVGINPEKIIFIVFTIGSALAGSAGILISLETNLEPTMGMNAILKGITAAVIGGIGSIPGAMLGGFLLGIAENLGIWKIQAGWKDLIAFTILIVFLFLRPIGILGTKTKEELL